MSKGRVASALSEAETVEAGGSEVGLNVIMDDSAHRESKIQRVARAEPKAKGEATKRGPCQYCGAEFLLKRMAEHVRQEHGEHLVGKRGRRWPKKSEAAAAISTSSHVKKAAKLVPCEYCGARIDIKHMGEHVREEHGDHLVRKPGRRW